VDAATSAARRQAEQRVRRHPKFASYLNADKFCPEACAENIEEIFGAIRQGTTFLRNKYYEKIL